MVETKPYIEMLIYGLLWLNMGANRKCPTNLPRVSRLKLIYMYIYIYMQLLSLMLGKTDRHNVRISCPLLLCNESLQRNTPLISL
jgi:hypothetical protein